MGSCDVTPSTRIFRAVAAIMLAGFSTSMWSQNLWCAVPAAICSSFLLIGALTGWCPTQLLSRGERHRPNTLGIPERLDVLESTKERV